MTISDQLRTAIRECGLSANELGKESGVPQPMITRFLNGSELRTNTVDKLAAYFRLELRPIAKQKRK
jgi:hypothetical protein